MKIVTRKGLMELRKGTVFSLYRPCVFDCLSIKDSPPGWGDDFLVCDLVGAVEHHDSDDLIEKLDKMERGESFPADFESCGRDGCFDNDQLYAVYERADVEKLIKRLQETL